MHKFWLGAVMASVALLAASGAQARNLSYADILGAWCGKEAKFVFTRGSLTVTWYGSSDRRVLAVKEYVFSPTSINVKWKPKGNTVFAEFSKDDRNMAQQPNTRGDMGPRRAFRRCK